MSSNEYRDDEKTVDTVQHVETGATESHRPPPYAGMSVGEYVRTRVTSLKPAFDPLPNPFKLLGLLTAWDWNNLGLGFAVWTWDAFDFFTVSLTVSNMAKTFDRSTKDITFGITLVLMLRSVGSITAGLIADRYGRRWVTVGVLVFFIIFELATGFCQTYEQFLAVRSLYGISMGAAYGVSVATAIEDIPKEARGLISGITQQAYAFGYLLATAFARALVNTTPHEWRPLYWFGACPPVLLIIWRALTPETKTFTARQAARKARPNAGKTFINEGKVALKKHWLLLLYLVCLMIGFNFLSHGSQDLYPTFLKNAGFDENAVTVIQVVANLGAMFGGTVIGYLSQSLGRRLCIICACVLGGALLYPYCFVSNYGIIAAAFFQQSAVQGAWGVVPIHLTELSPGSYRTFVVGTTYQLGNLASSASSTIEATIGERFPLPAEVSASGEVTKRYDYGKVIAIFLGCVYAYMIILTLIGPENRGANLDVEHDDDFTEAAGDRALDTAHMGKADSESDDQKMEEHVYEKN